MSGKWSILIVDDDQQMAESLKDIIDFKGYEAVTAFSGKEAIEKLEKARFDFLLTDIKMPEMSGVELLKIAKRIQPDIMLVLMTAYTSDVLAREGLNEGAVDVLQKPFDIDKFLILISTLIKEGSHGQ